MYAVSRQVARGEVEMTTPVCVADNKEGTLTKSEDPQGTTAVFLGISIGLVCCGLFILLALGMQGPPTEGLSLWILAGAEVFSTLAFALAGSYLSASHLEIKPSSSAFTFLLAVGGGIMTGVGGGLLRDLLILQTMPVLFTDLTLGPAAVIGAMIGLQLASTPCRTLSVAVETMDSIAMGVGIVVGTAKGYAVAGESVVGAMISSAIVCAILTSCGGGWIRDLCLLKRTPSALSVLGAFLPALGALVHTATFNVLRSHGLVVQPDEIWFVVPPIFAAIKLWLSAMPRS